MELLVFFFFFLSFFLPYECLCMYLCARVRPSSLPPFFSLCFIIFLFFYPIKIFWPLLFFFEGWNFSSFVFSLLFVPLLVGMYI